MKETEKALIRGTFIELLAKRHNALIDSEEAKKAYLKQITQINVISLFDSPNKDVEQMYKELNESIELILRNGTNTANNLKRISTLLDKLAELLNKE